MTNDRLMNMKSIRVYLLEAKYWDRSIIVNDLVRLLKYLSIDCLSLGKYKYKTHDKRFIICYLR